MKILHMFMIYAIQGIQSTLKYCFEIGIWMLSLKVTIYFWNIYIDIFSEII